MIIGLAGKMGVGKNFYAEYIINYLRKKGDVVLEMSFADQLKINVLANKYSYTNSDAISRNSIYDKKNDYTRSLLQKYGQDERDKNSDVWLNYMQEWIYLWARRGIKHFVINDVRYPNEVYFIESFNNSVVIKIDAQERNNGRLQSEYSENIIEKIKNHPSETSLDDVPFTNIIKNDPEYNMKENQECINKIIESLL
jgi:hypothetical protein